MVDFLRPVIKEKSANLTSDERNLLSVAFKNLISAQRTAIRTISAVEQNPKYQKHSAALADYKKKVEEELYTNCDMIINLIKSDIVPNAVEHDSKTFFLKMVGDYCRYISESATGDRLQTCKDQASKSYGEAQELATANL